MPVPTEGNIWLQVYPKILWIVGQQCAGKTMLTTVLGSCGAKVLHIGEQLRKTRNAAEFLHSENPYAPYLVEDEVQKMISEAIYQFKRESGTLVIDSAPRNKLQLPLLAEVQEMSTVIFVMEEYEVRRARARHKYGNDLTLFEKREAFEVEWIKEFVGMMVEHNIDHLVLGGRTE